MRIFLVVKLPLALLCLLAATALWAGNPSFLENKGQWHPNVQYRAELGGAYTYLDGEGITVLLPEEDFYTKLHNSIQGKEGEPFGKMHAVKFRFLGLNLSGAPEQKGQQKGSNNFFLGNDRSRWARDVGAYQSLIYRNVKPGIDLRYDLKNGAFKYEFILAPGADPAALGIEIAGAEKLSLRDGNLVVSTSVGEFEELAPFAFQRDETGRINTVPCEYRLRKNKLSYHFPKGYDTNLPLVIDPELAFSSFIGSASSNFGFTASYDDEGSLYAGAIVFGAQYPTTLGAFQVTFGAGSIDCGITKFNADGTELMFSTFLGGTDNEAPHSIVVSPQGETYVFGTTGSTNFPVTAGAFQSSFGGGNNLNTPVGFAFASGTDMFVAKLTPGGNNLMSSTYIGGSGNDGLASNSIFDFNYGDLFRGEIVLDGEGNAYVASVTSSANFPVANGYSSTHTANLSGVVFKFSSNLNNLLWSTYSGGNANETATSLQLADDNSVYFAGGTTSTNLATAGSFQPGLGGGADGYVAHVSTNGSTLLQCTYTGTAFFDQNYFVQLDTEGFVYVIGQSEGNYPVTSGLYTNPNSAQYIHKFNPTLNTGIWSTVVGSGNGGIDISPSAFLVSNCGQIYLAGWGGVINAGAGGSTNGLPITANAIQSTTDGSDFYIMVLSPDAASLVYATFFGGSQSAEHVDGGTSRFDKNGTVYQAVCAGCGGNSDFPTQPGVWSQSNNSNNCNLAVFKFALSSVQVVAEIDAPEIICPGTQINFLNLSIDADNFSWNFGDGEMSAAMAPTHSYSEPGTYEVWLYAESNDGCLSPDSTSVTVVVEAIPSLSTADPPAICPGETVQLQASGAENYQWSPAAGLSNATIENPIFSGDESTLYTVTGTSDCGVQSLEVQVTVGSAVLEMSEDVVICPGQSAVISSSGGQNFSWSPPDGLNDPNISNPTASPTETTLYTVTASTGDDCEATGNVQVSVLPPPPVLIADESFVSCNGIPAQLSVEGANTYSWSPSSGLSDPNVSNPSALPSTTTTYTVTGNNACGSNSIVVTVLVNSIDVGVIVDSLVCFNTPFEVSAIGGTAHVWQPAELFSNPEAQTTTAKINQSSLIKVTGFDADGCFSTAERLVLLYPRPFFTAGRSQVVAYGDAVQIESNSPYPILWEYNPYLSCLQCNFPTYQSYASDVLYASVISADGCVERDFVEIFVQGNLYVPNAFSPDGDGLNEIFKAEGIDITDFEMEIWDRWGQLVFMSNDIDQGWNGAVMNSGYYCPAGLYVYRIVARDRHSAYIFETNGHVTLLR
jgi:gliding motility-associated-like protein